ncbi:MAG: DNA starvation/stationary phase protection protein Dps [Hyphomonadaceae bacterium]|nr:DNA starvation/stationary phase protection protein Dps [Hyphomonadaceae bacterium]
MAKSPTSRIDLPDNTKKAMVALLNARLADAIDLGLLVKQAHWNVKGPTFIALHLLFDEIASRVEDQVDEIAERATALGGIAQGTTQAVAAASTLAPYPTDVTAEKEHLKLLAERLAAFGKNAREAIESADEAGDKDTADLFTGISRAIDKDLWFIESHLA